MSPTTVVVPFVVSPGVFSLAAARTGIAGRSDGAVIGDTDVEGGTFWVKALRVFQAGDNKRSYLCQ